MKKSILVLMMISLTFLMAEWSTDAALNNQISALTGDQTIPKSVQLADGSSYFGWWSNSTGNYNMRLQHFSAEGNELWDINGILISDNVQMSWLTDWDMTADLEGNAIMTFNDIREGEDNLNIYGYKISPAGEFLWGDDGIALSSAGFNTAPKVTVTANNHSIFTWADETSVFAVSLTAEGNIFWDQSLVINAADAATWPQVIAADDDGNGNFLLKYYVDSGPYWAPNRSIFLQKYDEYSSELWEEPAIVSDAYGISAWTQKISFVTDGSGGAVLAWHDDRNSENTSRAYVQHVNTWGEAFSEDGVLLADHAPNQMYYPQAVCELGTEEIFVFWRETDANQNNAGIYAQRLSSEGELLYNGNNGLEISPIQATGGTIIAARPMSDDAVVVYSLYPWGNFTQEQILAEKITADGETVWDEPLIISNMQTEKLHTDVADFFVSENGYEPSDGYVITWGSGSNGIFAQRFNADGSLGPPPQELPAPENLTAEFISLGFVLEWEMPDDRILQGFQVYCNDELESEITNPEIREYYYFPEAYITYTFYLKAVYDEGISAPSNAVSVFPGEINFPPQNLRIDPVTAIMEWNTPPMLERELLDYVIFLDGSCEAIITDTTYQFTGLTPGESYIGGVMAEYSSAGESTIVDSQFVYSPVSFLPDEIPAKTVINRIYPNPFNPQTTISFTLQEDAFCHLEIFNIKGQRLCSLLNKDLKAGKHSYNWNAEGNSSGVYYCVLRTGEKEFHHKLILLK